MSGNTSGYTGGIPDTRSRPSADPPTRPGAHWFRAGRGRNPNVGKVYPRFLDRPDPTFAPNGRGYNSAYPRHRMVPLYRSEYNWGDTNVDPSEPITRGPIDFDPQAAEDVLDMLGYDQQFEPYPTLAEIEAMHRDMRNRRDFVSAFLQPTDRLDARGQPTASFLRERMPGFSVGATNAFDFHIPMGAAGFPDVGSMPPEYWSLSGNVGLADYIVSLKHEDGASSHISREGLKQMRRLQNSWSPDVGTGSVVSLSEDLVSDVKNPVYAAALPSQDPTVPYERRAIVDSEHWPVWHTFENAVERSPYGLTGEVARPMLSRYDPQDSTAERLFLVTGEHMEAPEAVVEVPATRGGIPTLTLPSGPAIVGATALGESSVGIPADATWTRLAAWLPSKSVNRGGSGLAIVKDKSSAAGRMAKAAPRPRTKKLARGQQLSVLRERRV